MLFKIITKIYYNLAKITSLIPRKRTYVLNEDWKYLIILDSCRYDEFEKYNTIQGKLEKRNSPASQTLEWMNKNFKKANPSLLKKIIYITANPFMTKDIQSKKAFNGENFYEIYELWNTHWNNKYQTVLPITITNQAIKIAKKYPNKKLIIHYLQPHEPFIGKIKMPRIELKQKYKFTKEQKNQYIKTRHENLKLALSQVKKLIQNLKGKIIITADHGEALGEKFLYNHNKNIHIKEQIEIPWFIPNKKTSSTK